MKHILLAAVVAVAASGVSAVGPLYLDPKQPVERRVDDLMERMTLDEKIGQMCQYVGLAHMREAEKNATAEELAAGHARAFYKGLSSYDVEAMTARGEIGSFLHVLTATEADHLQKLAAESRLKIPVLIGIDAIHGNGLVRGSTIYPSPIGLASTFDPALVEQSARQTAVEMRATGSHWAFAPNIEIARDARWGRVGECFGEDPCLVSAMGVATVRGLQDAGALACVKHLVAGGVPNNGTNAAPVEMGEGELRNAFLPPFKAAVEQAQPWSMMPAHNELNGVPCHSSSWLMEYVMRREYGFAGISVSDWMDMEAIASKHRVAANTKEAFLLSVLAGVDVHMHGPEFAQDMKELIEEGRLPASRVDEACRKILEAKFRLGLFENRYTDPAAAKQTVFSAGHRNTALELARRSIVLLKNDGILPLDKTKYKKILVTGPNADCQATMGDWVFDQPRENYTTILDGIRAQGAAVEFADVGWNLRTISDQAVRAAVAKARACDLTIVVVGEDSFREHWTEKTCGENRDRWDITLWGRQQELVEAIHATGKPVVVVLVTGRPLAVKWIADNVPALVQAWEPGSTGGQAVGEVLFGAVNPSGKLPMTLPAHVGQTPIYYNYKPTQYFRTWIDGTRDPLYPFGHGLSYTSFAYSDLKVEGQLPYTVTVQVANTGTRAGEEVVQLYLRDDVSTFTRPVKELKGFLRVALAPGEKKSVTFTLAAADFSYYGPDGKLRLEPGAFTVMAGGSSRDAALIKTAINYGD